MNSTLGSHILSKHIVGEDSIFNFRVMRRIVLLISLAAALVVLTIAGTLVLTSCVPVSSNETIVFVAREKDTKYTDIYSIKADGSGLAQLTNNQVEDIAPNWSPDRKKIAFISDDQIHIMNPDGTGNRRLTKGFTDVSSPIWSPDGKRIAFGGRQDSNPIIWVMNADGTGLKSLTDNSTPSLCPAWSPDGTKITFLSATLIGNMYTEMFLEVMNSDGTEVKRLTNNKIRPSNPTWSPDGKKIAFVVYNWYGTVYSKEDPMLSVYTINPDGTGLTELTRNLSGGWGGGGADPVWAPDAQNILFLSERKTLGSDPDQYASTTLYIMDTDGTIITKVPECWNQFPTWSPDSKRIAFLSRGPFGIQLYVVNVDGTGLKALTSLSNFSLVFYPSWSTHYYTSYPY